MSLQISLQIPDESVKVRVLWRISKKAAHFCRNCGNNESFMLRIEYGRLNCLRPMMTDKTYLSSL